MKRPVIIGYGNPLREDDGLGWRAADLLASHSGLGAAEIIQRHQLLPELAGDLAEAALVVFLDAAVDLAPGEIRCERVEAEPPNGWSHEFGPSQLLGLALDLNGCGPAAYLIRGGVCKTDLGDQLSKVGCRCAEAMADAAITLLDGLLDVPDAAKAERPSAVL
ncbi:MAG: hydrogenase maturation protease [Bryobacteraceae bacterium]